MNQAVQRQSPGFTAIEILVVSSILGLILIISVPLLSSYQKTIKLHGEARQLATDLRLAQQRAVAEQTVYEVVLDTGAGSYLIRNAATATVIKTFSFDEQISVQSITGLDNATAQFTPTGAAIVAGDIVLVNTKNETATLSIKPSGYVQLTE